jgi:membrane protein DedA with SNARE-associated domain
MFAGIITDATDWLDKVASHWWFLLVILVIAFLDAVVPLVPSETCVIIGGVTAADGAYPLPLVILCAATGAFLGDNFSFMLGRRAGPWFERRAARNQKRQRRLEAAKRQIRERGGMLLITARFIPAGRTALTLACGITEQRQSWFVKWIAIAAMIWATYASLLGYIGGAAFEDDHTKAFLFAFGIALGANLVIELVRHFVKRHKAGKTVEETVVDVAHDAAAPGIEHEPTH